MTDRLRKLFERQEALLIEQAELKSKLLNADELARIVLGPEWDAALEAHPTLAAAIEQARAQREAGQ